MTAPPPATRCPICGAQLDKGVCPECKAYGDSLIGHRVARIDDDSACPLTGEITGVEGDEFAWVSWDGGEPARTALDELRPAGTR